MRLRTVVSVLLYFAVVSIATFFLYSCVHNAVRPAHAASMFFFNVGQGGGGGGGGGGGCTGALDLSAGCPLPPINGI